ncbi:MAG: energy transducer TonB [Kangiellaceae bacterium]|nr:energy transducer TonB [Kangiellaceae bacterium]
MKQILSVVFAVALSFFLFVLMSGLINSEAKAVPAERFKPIDITFDPKDTEVEILTRRIIKPPKMKVAKAEPSRIPTQKSPTPVKPIKLAMATTSMSGIQFQLSLVGDPGTGIAPGNNGESVGGPRVQVAPLYPTKAKRDGLEGYVTLTFDVDATGSPYNVKVVDAKPRGVFDKSARKALRKWKYNPKVEGGKAIEIYNQRVTLEFQLEGES